MQSATTEMQASPPRRNRDETVTKPFEFCRLNDETIEFYIILYTCKISLSYKHCGFVVPSIKLEWFRHGFVVVSSWFRQDVIRQCIVNEISEFN